MIGRALKRSRLPVAFAVLVASTTVFDGHASIAAASRGVDLVFAIDESGSMSTDIQHVRENVALIANEIGTAADARYGLVGFGASTGHAGTSSDGDAHVHRQLGSLDEFRTGLNQLVASGGFEPGLSATVLGMSDSMGFRGDAGTCMVLITDEDADDPGNLSTALSALTDRGATWFGIVDEGSGNTSTTYGPNEGSLAAMTGGQVFGIGSFNSNPQPVLEVLLESCLEAVDSRAVVIGALEGLKQSVRDALWANATATADIWSWIIPVQSEWFRQSKNRAEFKRLVEKLRGGWALQGWPPSDDSDPAAMEQFTRQTKQALDAAEYASQAFGITFRAANQVSGPVNAGLSLIELRDWAHSMRNDDISTLLRNRLLVDGVFGLQVPLEYRVCAAPPPPEVILGCGSSPARWAVRDKVRLGLLDVRDKIETAIDEAISAVQSGAVPDSIGQEIAREARALDQALRLSAKAGRADVRLSTKDDGGITWRKWALGRSTHFLQVEAGSVLDALNHELEDQELEVLTWATKEIAWEAALDVVGFALVKAAGKVAGKSRRMLKTVKRVDNLWTFGNHLANLTWPGELWNKIQPGEASMWAEDLLLRSLMAPYIEARTMWEAVSGFSRYISFNYGLDWTPSEQTTPSDPEVVQPFAPAAEGGSGAVVAEARSTIDDHAIAVTVTLTNAASVPMSVTAAGDLLAHDGGLGVLAFEQSQPVVLAPQEQAEVELSLRPPPTPLIGVLPYVIEVLVNARPADYADATTPWTSTRTYVYSHLPVASEGAVFARQVVESVGRGEVPRFATLDRNISSTAPASFMISADRQDAAVHVYDASGRHAGPASNGEIGQDIPGATYTLGDDGTVLFQTSEAFAGMIRFVNSGRNNVAFDVARVIIPDGPAQLAVDRAIDHLTSRRALRYNFAVREVGGSRATTAMTWSTVGLTDANGEVVVDPSNFYVELPAGLTAGQEGSAAITIAIPQNVGAGQLSGVISVTGRDSISGAQVTTPLKISINLDTAAPPPPVVLTQSPTSDEAAIELTGLTEPGAWVRVLLADEELAWMRGDEATGLFRGAVTLGEGLPRSVTLAAMDRAGNPALIRVPYLLLN